MVCYVMTCCNVSMYMSRCQADHIVSYCINIRSVLHSSGNLNPFVCLLTHIPDQSTGLEAISILTQPSPPIIPVHPCPTWRHIPALTWWRPLVSCWSYYDVTSRFQHSLSETVRRVILSPLRVTIQPTCPRQGIALVLSLVSLASHLTLFLHAPS